ESPVAQLAVLARTSRLAVLPTTLRPYGNRAVGRLVNAQAWVRTDRVESSSSVRPGERRDDLRPRERTAAIPRSLRRRRQRDAQPRRPARAGAPSSSTAAIVTALCVSSRRRTRRRSDTSGRRLER